MSDAIPPSEPRSWKGARPVGYILDEVPGPEFARILREFPGFVHRPQLPHPEPRAYERDSTEEEK
jgi:hypothetical protein